MTKSTKPRIDWKAVRAELADTDQSTATCVATPIEVPPSTQATGNGHSTINTQATDAVVGTDSPTTNSEPTPKDGASLALVQQYTPVVDVDLPPFNPLPTLIEEAAAAPDTGNSHISSDAHDRPVVAGSASRDGQSTNDTQDRSAVTGPDSQPSSLPHGGSPFAGLGPASSTGQFGSDTQFRSAGAGPLLADPYLSVAAETVNDYEDNREKTAAHLRELLDPKLHNCSPDNREVINYQKLLDAAEKIEKQAIKHLERVMALHPLGPWQEATTGIGPKQLGRLLGVIRDPYWNERDNRPRSVSELWAYCGYDTDRETGQARRRKRGEKANWSGEAKMRAHLLAKQQVKVLTSKYNPLYYATREHYAEAVHTHPCIQCGKKGKPAEVGTPLKDGHKHARALRAVAKAILRDLWVESERLHKEAARAVA